MQTSSFHRPKMFDAHRSVDVFMGLRGDRASTSYGVTAADTTVYEAPRAWGPGSPGWDTQSAVLPTVKPPRPGITLLTRAKNALPQVLQDHTMLVVGGVAAGLVVLYVLTKK